jgi:hypothetical protein
MLLLGDSPNPFTMILGFGHEPSEVTKKIAGAESLTHGAAA